MAVIDDTLDERAARYGKFIDNARIAQFLKLYIRKCPGWTLLEPDQKEALDNIMIKASRILSSGTDVNYTDNWHDIAGYATLVVERLNGNTR